MLAATSSIAAIGHRRTTHYDNRSRRDLRRLLSACLACLLTCRCVGWFLQRGHVVYQLRQQRVGSAKSFSLPQGTEQNPRHPLVKGEQQRAQLANRELPHVPPPSENTGVYEPLDRFPCTEHRKHPLTAP